MRKLRELIALHRKMKDKKTAVRINSVILWAKGWKYAKKKLLEIYYDRLHKLKEAVENFFEKEVKEESCKADLEKFIGTSFQIINR